MVKIQLKLLYAEIYVWQLRQRNSESSLLEQVSLLEESVRDAQGMMVTTQLRQEAFALI